MTNYIGQQPYNTGIPKTHLGKQQHSFTLFLATLNVLLESFDFTSLQEVFRFQGELTHSLNDVRE
jgi:hypothetical protein